MPELAQEIIDDLRTRLCRNLKTRQIEAEPSFLNAGGSAAVFRVASSEGERAFKVFDPRLFSDNVSAAERRRLDVQRRLIGHSCPYLVQTFGIEEAEGTAFVEMEFVPWPQLKKVLPSVPDENVAKLIMQLVEVVRFLESQDIIHRDIKPENIHISNDFGHLKLLDLGVAREFEADGQGEGAITDSGNQRPFLATAQYSSPEYLFRLDEPSPKLWQALNYYQVGAVLHDMIMKRPLFQQEMELSNRWLVARAVLTKSPSFADTNPARLSQLKALSSRCLVKDLDTRLQLVAWDDFILEGAVDPLVSLRARLAKGKLGAGGHAKAKLEARLEFDRTEFLRRLVSSIRSELQPTCGTQLPLLAQQSEPGHPPGALFVLTANENAAIECRVQLQWQNELYERTATVLLTSRLITGPARGGHDDSPPKVVFEVTALDSEQEAARAVAIEIAAAAVSALDLIEAGTALDALNGHVLVSGGYT